MLLLFIIHIKFIKYSANVILNDAFQSGKSAAVKILKIQTLETFAVITLKFEHSDFTIG